jgi:ribosome-binding factor A
METQRQQKIARLLQKDLGGIFQIEARNLFSGAMITVTKVHVTKDLSIAKVYLSLFAINDKPALMDQVRKHASEIRYKLGNRIRNQLRSVPVLEFYEDDSLDYIENIEKLLSED